MKKSHTALIVAIGLAVGGLYYGFREVFWELLLLLGIPAAIISLLVYSYKNWGK